LFFFVLLLYCIYYVLLPFCGEKICSLEISGREGGKFKTEGEFCVSKSTD